MFKKIAAILMLALANNNVARAGEFDSDTRLTNTELSTGLDLHYRSGRPRPGPAPRRPPPQRVVVPPVVVVVVACATIIVLTSATVHTAPRHSRPPH